MDIHIFWVGLAVMLHKVVAKADASDNLDSVKVSRQTVFIFSMCTDFIRETRYNSK